MISGVVQGQFRESSAGSSAKVPGHDGASAARNRPALSGSRSRSAHPAFVPCSFAVQLCLRLCSFAPRPIAGGPQPRSTQACAGKRAVAHVRMHNRWYTIWLRKTKPVRFRKGPQESVRIGAHSQALARARRDARATSHAIALLDAHFLFLGWGISDTVALLPDPVESLRLTCSKRSSARPTAPAGLPAVALAKAGSLRLRSGQASASPGSGPSSPRFAVASRRFRPSSLRWLLV
jgi:hypothetical protein